MPPGSSRNARALRWRAAPEIITSRDNRALKLFRAALQDSGAPQDWLGLEGPHLIEEAVRAGLALETILVSESGARHLDRVPIPPSAGAAGPGLRILRTTDRLFAAVSGTETPQGIAALVRPPEYPFEALLLGGSPLVVVLIAVQDPGNVGTTLRTAEAFGASGAISTRGTAHPLSPKALRASAGSVLRLPFHAGMAAPIALAQLRVAGLTLCAAISHPAPTSAISPATAELRGPTALLIGGEGSGLPPEIERAADVLLRIPLAPKVESLNAGVAASVLLYEAARQRGLFTLS